MIGSANPFTGNGQDRRAERRAIVFALQASLLFLFSFASVYKTFPHKTRPLTTSEQPAKPVIASDVKTEDPNDRYRVVPASFRYVDFSSRSYGRYSFSGDKFNLTLVDGEQTFPSPEGSGGETFSLRDVLYADVTGDYEPEAIVILSHVQCSGSCDGGSTLIYIYSYSKSGLDKIWEYETGSLAYGCGLKSFSVTRNTIVLEMFGRCSKPAGSYEGPAKFMIADTTRLAFRFNGQRFVKQLTEFTAEPARYVGNYDAPIQISEW
jgi:hypothetical protein